MKQQTIKNQSFWAQRKSRLVPVVLLALTFSAMLFIVAPFEIYCNNLAELSFSVKDFIGIQLLFALICFLFIFSLLYFIPKCVYLYAYPIVVGLLFMTFLQGNYLNVGISSLAGDQMGETTSVWTYVWNTALWIVVPAGFVVTFKLVKDKSIPSLIALVLTVVVFSTQLMNFSVGALTTEDAFSPAIDRVYGKYSDKPRFLTNKDIEKVGSDRNVVIFLVDRLDSELYAEPAMEKHPDAFAFLDDGFTYYKDHLSLYGYTFPSVGYMVSGIEYDHSPDHHEWFQKVYHENQTLSVLHDHGYNIHFYGENYYTYANANELPNYIENSVETERETLKSIVRKPFQFGWQFTKMALFRCFPFLLKAPVGGISSDTCNEYISYTSDELQGFEAYAYDMKTAYGYIKKHDGNFQFKGEKNFSFIHISGCHNTKYDENWKKRKNLEDHADKVQVSAKLSMAVVNKYIENMKAMGIYENSTIVIVGDHGKVGGGLANAQSSRMKDLKKPMRTALYVKPAGVTKSDFANGKMQTSNAPVSHENLWATIFQSENISYGESVDFAQKSVFDIESEFNGDYTNFARKFYWTKRHPSMNSYELVSYEIVGDSSVWESWKITDRKKYNHKLFHN